MSLPGYDLWKTSPPEPEEDPRADEEEDLPRRAPPAEPALLDDIDF